MQAALTGHLVFSTIHTNSSTATITRMRNLGVPPYLIASTINCILALRLVRVICTKCRVKFNPPDHDLARIGIQWKKLEEMYRWWKYCPYCRHDFLKSVPGRSFA
jgi:type II secretory ATPase GspE/PulE/Tfp pilus assembly ATPase PilB-like protein